MKVKDLKAKLDMLDPNGEIYFNDAYDGSMDLIAVSNRRAYVLLNDDAIYDTESKYYDEREKI